VNKMNWQEYRLNPLVVKAFVYKGKQYPDEIARLIERRENGAEEFQMPDGSWQLRFNNNNSSHIAEEGDIVVLDEFNYLQMYTKQHWQYRAKVMGEK
tara:strand:+ start:637 stop:927 length:291 start_codon:yes stop_codon:yes gene_type:complete